MPSTINHVYPTLTELQSVDGWLEITEQSTPFAKALGHKGLLTEELKRIAKIGVKVECISQEYDESKKYQRRDVVILVDDVARVIASTIIPSKILECYPALLNLGDNPIGEHLENNYDAIRSEPVVKMLAKENRFNSNFEEDTACCLRKYNYLLEHGDIIIVELFSTEILMMLSKSSKARR